MEGVFAMILTAILLLDVVGASEKFIGETLGDLFKQDAIKREVWKRSLVSARTLRC